MPRIREIFVCSNCGYESAKWSGQCPSCQAWNTFEEQLPVPRSAPAGGTVRPAVTRVVSEIDVDDEFRYHTGISEFDHVLGGGIVKGSLILLSGDPGIGKSTLLLQICQHLGEKAKILYLSGEESVRQIKLRADRLGVFSPNLFLAAETDLDTVIATMQTEQPDLVMVDSIQTMHMQALSSASGSVVQVRECTGALMKAAKAQDVPVFLVGHVNKDGNIAGPKVLEHIVDVVLLFEGDANLSYRIVRAVKNRYGSTNEIAVFEMRDAGLKQVEDPSMLLLSERPTGVSGSCVCSVMEGSRPVMAEVQALVTKTGFGNPRRTCTGFDYNRMAMLLAVLEKRAGYFFGTLDAFINVVGGLRLDEPAADLSIALALVSSLRDVPLDDHLVAFGEIGLTGEVRMVTEVEKRVKEAQKLGFTTCVLPAQAMRKFPELNQSSMKLIPVRNIRQAIAALFGAGQDSHKKTGNNNQ